MVYTCCVPGCNNRSDNIKFHAFPRKLEIFNIWIQRIGNPRLTNLDQAAVVRSYQVCGEHFSDFCVVPHQYRGKKKLKQGSLPTLQLPNFQEPPTQENSILRVAGDRHVISPRPSTSTSEPDMDTELAVLEVQNQTVAQPSTSEQNMGLREATLTVFAEDHCYFSPQPSTHPSKLHPEEVIVTPTIEDHSYFVPQTEYTFIGTEKPPELEIGDLEIDTLELEGHELDETVALTPIEDLDMLPLTPQEQIISHENESPIFVTPEMRAPLYPTGTRTPRTRKDIRYRLNVLRSVGVTTQGQLTPKARKLYRSCTAIVKTARTLERKNKSVQEKLQKAQQLINTNEHLQANVNSVTYEFLQSQLRLQRVQPHARRFTMQDKITALSICKQSPKGYRLLQKLFTLPSKRTLMRLLGRIPFSCGINEKMVGHLRRISNNLKEEEKLYVLLFDEMFLQTGLSYNSKLDIIDGFEDYGNNQRKAEYADHATVFMIRGIYKKWKQPFCYFFYKGSLTTVFLKNTIKDIISTLQDIGLNVVATIRDQSSTNRSTYSKLKADTDAYFLRQGKENRSLGFYVNNQEIIPLFDPPHLLKGIRNNLLVGERGGITTSE